MSARFRIAPGFADNFFTSSEEGVVMDPLIVTELIIEKYAQ